jgi:hypothetical protein
MTRSSEYQVNRKMPWSSSPRFSNGSKMYSRLTSQVLKGDGRLGATVPLKNAHTAITIRMPTSGKSATPT